MYIFQHIKNYKKKGIKTAVVLELESEPLRSDVVAAIKKVIMLEIVNIVGVQVIVEQEDVEHVMEVVNM